MKVNKNINNKKNVILGIQILRILFSFHILVFHFIRRIKYESKIIQFIIYNVSIDLCTFFIISFYLSYNCFSSRNIIKIKHRFKRLLIPYIIWPYIFFTLKLFTNYKTQIIQFKFLYYQLIIGNGINIVYWFLFNIILISLIFTIIIFLSKRSFLIYLFLIGILFYLLEYYLYYSKFLSFFEKIISFPIEHITSSYLYSLTGFYLSSINFIEKLRIYSIKIIFLCLLFIYFFIYCIISFKFAPFISIIIIVLSSVSLLTLFILFPFSKLNNSLFGIIIKQLAKYSGGIYYIHVEVGKYLYFFSKENRLRTIYACIINYIICNIICIIGLKIFRKSSLSYLFL